MNAFRFVGKLEFNKLDSKNPYIRKGNTKKGDLYQTLSFSVVPTKNNRAFVERFGMVEKTIKTKNADGNDIEIAWDDRTDEKIINTVARYRRFSVKLNGTYYEFISAYDFVQFVADHVEEMKSKVFVVTGTIQLNVYNGKLSFRYQAQNIREVGDEEEVEQKLTVRFDSFYRKEDIDFDTWRTDKEIIINAFTYQYVDKDVQSKYVPTTYYINLADETNDKKVAFFLKQFGIILDGDSIKTKIKDKEVASIPVRCEYINGSEEVQFDESCLTDNQKEMIELGLKTLDDFKPNGSVFGERVEKFTCIDVDTRGDYADGYLTEDFDTTEFAKNIFTPGGTEVKADEATKDDDIDALFS